MEVIKGDLVKMFLQGEVDVLIHGCNCFNAMGAGIAGQIAKEIPEAKLADDNYIVRDNVMKLGNWSYNFVRRVNRDVVTIGTVINLYTQYYPGPDLSLSALYLGFEKLSRTLDRTIRIGIPRIGCGIAGGDWSVIGPQIEVIMKNHDLVLVEYEKNYVSEIKT